MSQWLVQISLSGPTALSQSGPRVGYSLKEALKTKRRGQAWRYVPPYFGTHHALGGLGARRAAMTPPVVYSSISSIWLVKDLGKLLEAGMEDRGIPASRGHGETRYPGENTGDYGEVCFIVRRKACVAQRQALRWVGLRLPQLPMSGPISSQSRTRSHQSCLSSPWHARPAAITLPAYKTGSRN